MFPVISAFFVIFVENISEKIGTLLLYETACNKVFSMKTINSVQFLLFKDKLNLNLISMNWYNNKRIVVTGATSGIGRLLLNRLIEAGAKIIAVGRNIDCLPVHKQVIPFKCDVSHPENLDLLFEFSLINLGEIDVFFANAGFGYYEELNDPDWKHIDLIFRTNVYAPIYGLEKMICHAKGRDVSYVITASEVARSPFAGFSLYTSTKFAISGFAQTMQLELPRNIYLTTVYPVALKTNFFSRSGENASLPPFFQQSVETTVQAILKGVAKQKEEIHPMFLLNLTVWLLDLYLPFRRWVLKQSAYKLKKGLASSRKEN